MSDAESSSPHVLISGAGITGLLLAQALSRANVRYTVFERDADPLTRGAGWGITIHWALTVFLSLVPDHIANRIPDTVVNRDASDEGEMGHFTFYDLRSGQPKWKVPPNADRLRVSREKLRRLLMDGIDIKWSKRLTDIDLTDPKSVTVRFEDSSSEKGTLLVGCDGSRSCIREILFPSIHRNESLPIRLIGANVRFPAHIAQKMLALDPFFLQGGDPLTDAYLWFSFLDMPSKRQPSEDTDYICQVMVSWPFRPGFMGDTEPIEVPRENAERLAHMRRLAEGWAEPFGSIVRDISEGTEVKEIRVEDWAPPMSDDWDRLDGRVTVVGDAAHAMTMYRGEAANHGIVDVSTLLSKILPEITKDKPDPLQVAAAVSAYQKEMVARTNPAVLLSRQACLDANDHARINEESPLLVRRAAKVDKSAN